MASSSTDQSAEDALAGLAVLIAVRNDPQALSRVAEALWTAFVTALCELTVRALRGALDSEELRAWDALRDQGDAEHFLRVFGGGQRRGDTELIERVLGLSPVEEFAAEAARRNERRATPEELTPLFGTPGERDGEPPYFDWKTLPELNEWAKVWVAACRTVADAGLDRIAQRDLAALARGVEPEDTPEAQAVRELGAADQLLLAAAEESPRGFAAGDPVLYQRLQNVRKRVRRRAEKLSNPMSE